jgi:hypothetical protein
LAVDENAFGRKTQVSGYTSSGPNANSLSQHDGKAMIDPKSLLAVVLIAIVGCAEIPPTVASSPAPMLAPTSIPSAVPTAAPTRPTPSSTSTSRASTRAPTATVPIQPTLPLYPETVSFTVTPTSTFALGQNLSISWQARSEIAEICGIIEVGPTDCRAVPQSGKMTFVTSNASVVYYALALRATTGVRSTLSMIRVRLCADSTQWFFDDGPPRCPQPVNSSRAAAQNFEHGTMIWLPKPDTLFALYDGSEQTFEMLSAPYTFKPGAAQSNRVGGAPKDLFEPINGFGQLWRGEFVGPSPSVRQRLGWATAPEFNFDTTYQCLIAGTRLWSCYLRDPLGHVMWLRPDSTAQVNFVWSVYPSK